MACPVILLGATGLTGRHAATILLADGRCSRLIAATRRLIGIDHPKLEPLPLNPSPAPLPPLAGAVFLCCLGSTIKNAGSQENFRRIDYDLPLAYARAALAAGAERCVLVGPLSIYRPIQAATLAQALVHTALAEPPQPGSRIHHWREIVAASKP